MIQKTDNIWISLFIKLYSFIISVGYSLLGLITGRKNTRKSLYENMDFVVKKLPSSWSHHPTGIGIGRSVLIAILYFFQKHVYFHEDK